MEKAVFFSGKVYGSNAVKDPNLCTSKLRFNQKFCSTVLTSHVIMVLFVLESTTHVNQVWCTGSFICCLATYFAFKAGNSILAPL